LGGREGCCIAMPVKIDNPTFDANGLVVARLDIKKELETILRDVFDVFSFIRSQVSSKTVKKDEDVIDFYQENQKMQFQALKQCWNLPSIMAIGNNGQILNLVRKLGIKHPLLQLPPLFRCDMPVEKQSIFHQHQDYTYNLGSLNSVTVWIPLADVGVDEGALKVVPGSHKAGIYPHKDGIITGSFAFEFVQYPMSFGDVLAFNQKLVHASGRNISQKIRFSIQIRYTDLECKDFISRGWPLNHSYTTEEFAKPTI
jgi:ectoine hydroxylase-related dioxygenase (phytanoyl-CoA dioxygenase family)